MRLTPAALVIIRQAADITPPPLEPAPPAAREPALPELLADNRLKQKATAVSFQSLPLLPESKAMKERQLYPEIEPYDTGHLLVSEQPLHRIYYEQYGNPEGDSVFFLHGGPGSASKPEHARYFDPEHYRIIMHHQRGTG